MKRSLKIFSYTYIFASAAAAPFMSLYELKLMPICIWVFGLLLATVGMFCTLYEKENAPDERQLNQGNSKKFYNFILTDKGGVSQ